VLGLSRLALSFFFKDDLGLDPAEVCVCVCVCSWGGGGCFVLCAGS
jgi:hypothetical protein